VSEPRLLVKYDYNNQQIKIEPKEDMSKGELTRLGRDIFHLIKDQRHSEAEINQLDTRLYKLNQAMREVESVIRFLRYAGGDRDQKDNTDDVDFKSASQPDSSG